MGFYCFTSPTAPVVLSDKAKVIALSQEQRDAIYAGFINNIPSTHLDHKLGISKEVIQYVFDGMDAIQVRCKQLMRSEVIVTPAVMSADGLSILTPAVMNVAPTTATILRTTIAPEFIEDFPGAAINTIVNMAISYSKYDGTGTWAFYSTNIKL